MNLPPAFMQAYGGAMQQAQQMRPPAPPPGQSFMPPWMQSFPRSPQGFFQHPELAAYAQAAGNWMQQRPQMPQMPQGGMQGNSLWDMIQSRVPPGTNLSGLQTIMSPMMMPFNMMQQLGRQPSLSSFGPQLGGWGR